MLEAVENTCCHGGFYHTNGSCSLEGGNLSDLETGGKCPLPKFFKGEFRCAVYFQPGHDSLGCVSMENSKKRL